MFGRVVRSRGRALRREPHHRRRLIGCGRVVLLIHTGPRTGILNTCSSPSPCPVLARFDAETPRRPRPRGRRRPSGRPGGGDVRALRAAARHHRRQRSADRQPARRTARDRPDHLDRPGDAAVLPGRRRGRRLRLARRHVLGDVAVQPGPTVVPARVLVPGRMVGRAARDTTVPGRRLRRRARTRVRRTAVVPRRVPRRARLRSCADADVDGSRGRRRGRLPDRRRRGDRRDSVRRRHAHGGRGKLRGRLADPGGDRRGLRPPADRPARGACRGRVRIRRAGRARGHGALRRLPGRDRDRADLQRVTTDVVARAALHLDVIRVRGRRGSDPPVGRATPCLVRRRGRQRGSDDALPLAHPRHRGRHVRPARSRTRRVPR